MNEENENQVEDYPVIEFEDFDRVEEINIESNNDVEVLEGGLEDYKEEESILELTFLEKKKHLRAMGRKDLTDMEIENLSEDEVEEIKEFLKLKERKAIYRFLTGKKQVTDEDVVNFTDEEVKEMLAKAYIMARHLTYKPKKVFGATYKKERQRKNKQAKASRIANRR